MAYTPSPLAPQFPKIGVEEDPFAQLKPKTFKTANLPKPAPKTIAPLPTTPVAPTKVSTGALAMTGPIAPVAPLKASGLPNQPIAKPKIDHLQTIKNFYEIVDEKDPRDQKKLQDIAQLKSEMQARNLGIEDQKRVISNYLLKNVAQDLKASALQELQAQMKTDTKDTYKVGQLQAKKDDIARNGAIVGDMVDVRKIYDETKLTPAEKHFFDNWKSEDFYVPLDQIDKALQTGQTEGEGEQGFFKSAVKWAQNLGAGTVQGATQAITWGVYLGGKALEYSPVAALAKATKWAGDATGNETMSSWGQTGLDIVSLPSTMAGDFARYNTAEQKKFSDTDSIAYQGGELVGNLAVTAPITLGGGKIATTIGTGLEKVGATTLGNVAKSGINQVATEWALQTALATQMNSAWTTGELASAKDTLISAGQWYVGWATLGLVSKWVTKAIETAPGAYQGVKSTISKTLGTTPEAVVNKNMARLKEVSITGKSTKVLANAEKKGFKPMEDVAKYDNYKPDIVDGKIDSERVIWEIHKQAGDQADLLSKALKEEGKTVSVKSVYDNMVKNVTKSLDDSKDLADGIARANKFKDLLERKATNGEISLSDLADIKKRAYNDINFLADANWSVDTDKAVARTFKEAIEKGSSNIDVKALNNEIARQYAIADYLGSIHTKAMKGWRLGNMAARFTGNIAWSSFWPFGAIIGGEISAKIQKSLLANSIKATKTMAPESALFKNLADDLASGKLKTPPVAPVETPIPVSKIPSKPAPKTTQLPKVQMIKIKKTEIPKTKKIPKIKINLPKVKVNKKTLLNSL